MPRRAKQRRPWAFVAVALWFPSAAIGMWWFIKSADPAAERSSEPAPEIAPDDTRQGISVTYAEREIALSVMRTNLELLHQILAAMKDNDRVQVARLATKAAHLPGPARRSPGLRAKLPPQWRAMGKQVDAGYRQLADAAATPDGALMEPLTAATSACVSCHAVYRLDLEP